MQTSTFDTQARTMALNAISAYKQYISPIKGFSCPHRLLHNSLLFTYLANRELLIANGQ